MDENNEESFPQDKEDSDLSINLENPSEGNMKMMSYDITA